MNQSLTFLKDFLIGGFALATISFIANNVNSALAGLIIGIPLGVSLMLFIVGHKKIIEYNATHTISLLLTFFLTVLAYYLYIFFKFSKIKTVIICLSIWIVTVLILWKSNLLQMFIDYSMKKAMSTAKGK